MFQPVVLIADEAAYGVDYAVQHVLESMMVHVYRLYLGGVRENAVNVLSGKIPVSQRRQEPVSPD